MFGNQITERKGLDLTIPHNNTTKKKLIFKILFITLVIISSGIFLYSSTTAITSYFCYDKQQLTNLISNIPAKIDIDVPLSIEQTNVDINVAVRELIDKKNVESIGLEYIIKREDKKGDNTDDNNKDDNNNDDSKKKSKPIYDQPGMRFVFALFAFVFLNMIAICIHHIYMKITNAANAYKTVDDEISPF